jgi:hypothetical protein
MVSKRWPLKALAPWLTRRDSDCPWGVYLQSGRMLDIAWSEA